MYVARGHVYGYTGDGSRIPVSLRRVDTDEEVAFTYTTDGGEFSVLCPEADGLAVLYAIASQPPSLSGRSSDGLADSVGDVLVGGEYEVGFDRTEEAP